MVGVKPAAVALVIGDLVGSRAAEDRSELHSSLLRALTEVNAHLTPLRPFHVTVGDEFQGVFATLGEALTATLLVRLQLQPTHDVRHGVAWGARTVLDESGIEDGPGWWAARAAIEAVHEAEQSAASRHLRTVYRMAPDVDGPSEGPVNAALVLRDERVSSLSERSLSVLCGLLDGRSQKDIAEELSISPSAVSQRVRADGLAALVSAHELLGRA